MIDFKVSVIIPVYNAAKHLKTAVDSALLQPETQEVILIDDGSLDNSASECKVMAENDDRIKFYQHPNKSNLGAGHTRNFGIKLSKCEYVAFLDADDYYLENRFKKTIETFRKHTDADGVYECLGTYFENDEFKRLWNCQNRSTITTMDEEIAPSQLFLELLRGKNGHIHLNTLTLKKTSIEIKFSDLKLTQDALFTWMLAASKNLYPGELKNQVAIRRVHGGNRHTKSMKLLISYGLKALEMLVHWLEVEGFDAQKIKVARKSAFSRKVDHVNAETFYVRKQKQALLLSEVIKDTDLLFSKYSIKLILAFFGLSQFKKDFGSYKL